MKGIRKTDKNTRRFITISDAGIWDKIDEIMTLPKYEKSFNKIINEALFIGIPKLHTALFGTATENEETNPNPIAQDIPGEFMLRMVRLIREVIVNANVNKSILCSLFNLKENELDGTDLGRKFSKGNFQFTPDFLANYEVRELVKLRETTEI